MVALVLAPATKSITDMIMKEEEILFPMTMDELNDSEWYEIYLQTNEIGYCLWRSVGRMATFVRKRHPEENGRRV